MAEYAATWSGGKDSCFACWKAISEGLKVTHLLNFFNGDSGKSASHGLDAKLIALQAQAIGLPIVQQGVTRETYETGFKIALKELKLKGVTGLITGDIYLKEHKAWIERVCGESGIEAVLPLWNTDTSRLLTDFIAAGFKSIIVSVKSEVFDQEWLGRELDSKLADELYEFARKTDIDPAGEHGEFHTFVFDGPIFTKPIKVTKSNPVFRENCWFLDILEYGLD